MINLKHVPNIFSSEGRTEEFLKHTGGNLESYIPDEFRSAENHAILSNTGSVDFAEWEATPVKDGEEIIVTPVVEGPVTWAAVGGALMNTAYASAVVAGVIAVNKAVSKSRPGYGDGSFSQSPTYGWDGIQSTASVGTPIPLVYGKNRLGGNVIQAFQEEELADEAMGNYAYILLALGLGEFQSVAGLTADTTTWVDGSSFAGDIIAVDGNPIRNLVGSSVQVRLGSDTQEYIRGFHDIHHVVAVSVQLLKDDPVFITTETGDAESVKLTFTADNLSKTGGGSSPISSVATKIKVYYKEADVGDRDDPASWTYDSEVKFRGKSLSQTRWSYRLNLPSAGQWDIKLVKTTKDSDTKRNADVFLSSIDEIATHNQAYPGLALLGLRLLSLQVSQDCCLAWEVFRLKAFAKPAI